MPGRTVDDDRAPIHQRPAGMVNEGLETGRYDAIVDRRIERLIGALDPAASTVAGVDDADQPHRLAAQVTEALSRRLAGVGDAEQRVTLVNQLLDALDESAAGIQAPPRRLLSVAPPPQRHAVGPDIPLSQHDLLVNARGEPTSRPSSRRNSPRPTGWT